MCQFETQGLKVCRRNISVMLAVLFMGLFRMADAEILSVQYHGSGWIQFGLVENSSDTVSNGSEINFNQNWIQNTGGQITAVGQINKNWEGGLGLGAIQVSNSRGSLLGAAHTWSNGWNPFVTEARVTYSRPLGEKNKLQLTLGSFPYDYNPDIRNFGLYLTRGQVYPGTLLSGFETKHILPIATQVGVLARIQAGGWQNDLLFNSETETKPYFDFSVADIVSYQVTPSLQIGAGVNFYRVFPQNSSVTSPGRGCIDEVSSYQNNYTSNGDERCFILGDTVKTAVLDSVGHPVMDSMGHTVMTSLRDPSGNIVYTDTTTGSMFGVKLMARFHLDLKLLFGFSALGSRAFGKNDLIFYGEAAVLGLKDYPKYYDDIRERMPVMVGFNLPAFGLVDRLALEVEYYGSKNYPDYGNAETNSSWVPRVPSNPVNNARNDWKWSLYASRVLFGHMRIAAQVANDHLLLPAPPANQDPSWAEVLTTPKDWYWMLKLAYFF